MTERASLLTKKAAATRILHTQKEPLHMVSCGGSFFYDCLLQAELFRVKVRVIPEAGHDLGVILQDRIGVLKVRSQTTVLGLDGPAVLGLGDLAVVLADHGLDGNGHAGHKARAAALMAVVGHFRVLVQLTAGAVAHELADDRETGVLAVALHGIADVADAVAGHSLLDALIQSSLGHVQQALCFQIDLTHRIGAGIVAVEAVDLCTGVDADDVTGADDDVMRRDTMDDGIVQADAGRARKAIQTLEIGDAAVLHDDVRG